jgi:O-antigen/teichoic acid export membrane protein
MSAIASRLRLLRHAHVRNFLLLFSAGGGARVLQVAAYPVLLFIYTPEQFGLYAGFTAIASVAATLATMRYELAIPVARSVKHAAGIVSLCVITAGTFCILMLLAFGIFPRTLSNWIGLPGLAPVAWLSAISMFGMALYGALTYWAVRFAAFPAIARTQIMKPASELGTQLALGFAGFGIWGLAIGNVVGMCTGIGSLLRVGDLPKLARQSPARLIVLAKSWRDFPLYSGTAGLLSQAATRFTLVALGAMFSPAALGLLWSAFAILEAPTSIVATAAGNIFYQRASEIWRTDPARLRGLYVKTVGGAFVFSLAGGALAFFALPWLIHVGLPARWSAASGFVQALIPAYVGQLSVMPFNAYGIARRQRWQLAWNALYLAANLGVVAAAHLGGSSLVWLVTVLSLTRFAAFVLVVPIHMHILKPPQSGRPLNIRAASEVSGM